jgi:glyoxylase-like metal-dependent hydrolase (beta-lactamase superfamily II)
MKGLVAQAFLLSIGVLGFSTVACAATVTEPAPQAQQIAAGVWLIPGGMRADREPDGNSVIFAAPAGLVVLDTGRHDWQARAIIDFATASHQAIAAVVNSHWHLDHVSGNPALRAAFPGLHVYASDAMDGALVGFLAASARDSEHDLNDESIPADTRADIRLDLATIRNGAALKPDVFIKASGNLKLAGRRFDVHLAPAAATAGDVWLFDRSSRIAALGDLVTLPAPFLDTACPQGWLRALDDIARTPFALAVPGHGTPMSRAQFADYRNAFAAFIKCADSSDPGSTCAAQWSAAVKPLLDANPREMQRAIAMAGYYVDLLRAHGGRSQYCATA